jgi:hypothetical protein
MGDDCLFGCVALDCMDLTVGPVKERLVGHHTGAPTVFRADAVIPLRVHQHLPKRA